MGVRGLSSEKELRDGSLLMYERDRFRVFSSRDGLRQGSVRAFYEDRDGILWIGGSAGLARFQDGHFRTTTALPITDVMTSLQTGLIDGVYGSPLAMIALQWFTRVKYMYDVPLANAAGAVLIAKSVFDKMPKDRQELLLSTGKTYLARLTAESREERRATKRG